MNENIQALEPLYDPDFDPPEVCPASSENQQMGPTQPFSWKALLNQMPARPAFFLGVGAAFMIFTVMGFLILLSLVWGS